MCIIIIIIIIIIILLTRNQEESHLKTMGKSWVSWQKNRVRTILLNVGWSKKIVINQNR